MGQTITVVDRSYNEQGTIDYGEIVFTGDTEQTSRVLSGGRDHGYDNE